MIRWVKLGAIFLAWPLYFAVMIACHLSVALLRPPNRWQIISRVSQSFLVLLRSVLGIKVLVNGDCAYLHKGGYVIIGNHVSYVDGIVLGSVFPVVFVSKDEVRGWLVIGRWAALCGTIFVHRGKKQLVGALIAEIRRKLSEKANILLFPEGTAGDGQRLLPFQTAMLAAPLRNRSVIVAVTLTYTKIDGRPVSAANQNRVYCYGPMAFVPHFWNLLATRGAEAVVTIRQRIECSRYEDNSTGRKGLAEDCYRAVLGTTRAAEQVDDPEAERFRQLLSR